MKIGKRLLIFIKTCYETQNDFSIEVGLSPSNLNRIIKDINSPGFETLIRFKEAGLSIDWLLDGKGSMYAHNATGEELRERNRLQNSSIELLPLNSRIKLWIMNNYESLERFSELFDIDYEELYLIVYENIAVNYTFINKLKTAGCNINWLYSGDGSPYEENLGGKFLLSRHEGKKFLEENEDISKILGSDIVSMKEPSDLLALIRLAIKLENKDKDIYE